MQTDAHMDVSACTPTLCLLYVIEFPSLTAAPSFFSPLFPSLRSSCSSGTRCCWTCGG